MSTATLSAEEIKKVNREKSYKVALLVCVTSVNNNKYFNLFQVNANEYMVVRGRVDQSEVIEGPYPMSKWDSTVKSKTKSSKKPKPYVDQTYLFEEASVKVSPTKKSSMFGSHRSDSVVSFVKTLQKYANESVEENYTVSAASVTRKQVDKAQETLTHISDLLYIGSNIEKINDTLLELYHIIPRRMKKVSDFLIQGSLITGKQALQEAKDMIGKEQDTLDVMEGQVNAVSVETVAEEAEDKKVKKEFDLLQSLSIDIEDVDAEEIKLIKKMLNQKNSNDANLFIRAYKVKNLNTEKTFANCLTTRTDKKKDLLWHGSRNENWFSIAQQGLRLRPTNAIITGKMWGAGTYFAAKASKSINYTSYSGAGRSYTGGRATQAILAIYDVHLGKQYVLRQHDSSHSQLKEADLKRLGFDSTHAMAGPSIANDEFIVYNETQSTIRYMVEIGN